MIWKHERGTDLVVLGDGRVYGYDPATGAERWYVSGFAREPIAVPVAGNAVPFVAGISATSPEEETVGLYDPLGHGVAFLANDGHRVTISRGPAADLAGFRGAPPLDAGPVSLARILSGAPGYMVVSAEAGRYGDGAWSLSDSRQTLRSDPGRRFLAGAEYRVPGMRVTVDYPGRESADPPERIVLSVPGAKFTLRRDAE